MDYEEAWRELERFIESVPFDDAADLILLNSISMKMNELKKKVDGWRP